jgi:hypothetical protein
MRQGGTFLLYRIYQAADFAAYFGTLVSNGIVYESADSLKPTPSSGRVISVAPGIAWINGYRYENTGTMQLTVGASSAQYIRKDRVVIRWSLEFRNIGLFILPGAASASPSAPALTRSTDVYELGIAEITIPAGASSISASNIADTRFDTNLCGQVNSKVTAVYA